MQHCVNLAQSQDVDQPKKNYKAFLIVLFIAVLVRVAFLVAYGPHFGKGGDDVLYREMALNLLDKGYLGGQGTRPPLYPLFLAGIWAVFGRDNFLAVAIIQGLLGVLTSLLWFVSVYKLLKSIPLAIMAGIASTMDLPLVILELRLLTEPLSAFMFALISFLFIISMYDRYKSGLLLWILGFIIAFLALTRVMFAGFAFIPAIMIAIFTIRSRGHVSELVSRTFAILFPSIILVAVLLCYNYIRFGYPTLTRTFR